MAISWCLITYSGKTALNGNDWQLATLCHWLPSGTVVNLITYLDPHPLSQTGAGQKFSRSWIWYAKFSEYGGLKVICTRLFYRYFVGVFMVVPFNIIESINSIIPSKKLWRMNGWRFRVSESYWNNVLWNFNISLVIMIIKRQKWRWSGVPVQLLLKRQ